MKSEENIKRIAGKDTGLKVPPDFFDNIYDSISASLPEREIKPEPRPSMWVRMRPYVYLAAMFAGIWCMMKVFQPSAQPDQVSLDNPPKLVAQAVDDSPEFRELYASAESSGDYQLETEVISEYDSFDQFEKDFGYELEEEYENIDIDGK